MSAAGRYDDHAEDYDAYHRDPKSLAENRWVAGFLAGFVPKDGLLADFGCGTGLLLELHDRAPERYLGIDLSEGMLGVARRKFPRHRFAAGNMEGPIGALRDGEAAAVVSLFGSPSYCELEPLRREVERVLAPGGRYWLMFCGLDYRTRSTYINKDGDSQVRPYPAEAIRRVFGPESLTGLGWAVDRLPAFTPTAVFDAWLGLEAETVGRWRPESCWFLNVAGRKPG
jgi:SAM-dependent methyltransferase